MPVEERRLVDDVDAPAHRVERRRLGFGAAQPERGDVLDDAALRDEPLEVGGLALEPLDEDEVERVVVAARTAARPALVPGPASSASRSSVVMCAQATCFVRSVGLRTRWPSMRCMAPSMPSGTDTLGTPRVRVPGSRRNGANGG